MEKKASTIPTLLCPSFHHSCWLLLVRVMKSLNCVSVVEKFLKRKMESMREWNGKRDNEDDRDRRCLLMVLERMWKWCVTKSGMGNLNIFMKITREERKEKNLFIFPLAGEHRFGFYFVLFIHNDDHQHSWMRVCVYVCVASPPVCRTQLLKFCDFRPFHFVIWLCDLWTLKYSLQ